MSTSDFDPRFLELWRDGGTRRVVLPMVDVDSAIALRHRLYRCRQQMKKEKHPFYELASRAAISVIAVLKDKSEKLFSSKKSTPIDPEQVLEWIMAIQPADTRFDEALAAVGYKVPEPPSLD